MFVSVLQAPQVPRGQFQRAYEDTVCTGFPSKSRNHELGESIYFMADLLFALEREMILSLQIAYSKHDLSDGWGTEQSGLSILYRDKQGSGPMVHCGSQDSLNVLS